MKKLFLMLMIAIAAFTANAEGYRMAAGLNLGVAPCIEKGASWNPFGLGAKYQYYIFEEIRLEGDMEYWFKTNDLSAFDISANVQYVIPIIPRLNLYPTVGIGFGNVHFHGAGAINDALVDDEVQEVLGEIGIDPSDLKVASNSSRFLFNIGLGAEYELTERFVASAEFKYQYMKDFQRMPIMVGIAYRF